MSKKTEEMSILEHLEELRKVLIVSVIGTIVFAIAAIFLRSDSGCPIGTTTVGRKSSTGVTEAIWVKIKLSIFMGFLAAMPIILWQI